MVSGGFVTRHCPVGSLSRRGMFFNIGRKWGVTLPARPNVGWAGVLGVTGAPNWRHWQCLHGDRVNAIVVTVIRLSVPRVQRFRTSEHSFRTSVSPYYDEVPQPRGKVGRERPINTLSIVGRTVRHSTCRWHCAHSGDSCTRTAVAWALRGVEGGGQAVDDAVPYPLFASLITF